MRAVGLLWMRIVAGGLLAVHGYAKLFGGEEKGVHPLARRYLGPGFEQAVQRGGVRGFSQSLTGLGVPVPGPMAALVGLTEFVGGLLVVTGTLTRLAAAALSINLVVAIKLAHWKHGIVGQGGYAYGLSLLGTFVGLLLAGPGALSVDGEPERWLPVLRRRAASVDEQHICRRG
ncbi:MAG TPA: DoxX family protein [Dehalococcoidia bacterium]|nr:DoxX family protein [Dehalococcoidia bacterium]